MKLIKTQSNSGYRLHNGVHTLQAAYNFLTFFMLSSVWVSQVNSLFAVGMDFFFNFVILPNSASPALFPEEDDFTCCFTDKSEALKWKTSPLASTCYKNPHTCELSLGHPHLLLPFWQVQELDPLICRSLLTSHPCRTLTWPIFSSLSCMINLSLSTDSFPFALMHCHFSSIKTKTFNLAPPCSHPPCLLLAFGIRHLNQCVSLYIQTYSLRFCFVFFLTRDIYMKYLGPLSIPSWELKRERMNLKEGT